MQDFIEIPSTKQSIAKRRPLYGIGKNDSDYVVKYTDKETGKRLTCPFYRKWKDMLMRCYSSKYHEKRPTYVSCSVAEDWKCFSNFKSWMVDQDWEGLELDKDLLCPGNKVYGPKHCLFVPSQLNTLLNDQKSARGDYPIGVCFDKESGKFRAHCRVNGKTNYIGRFTTPEAASLAYRQFKSALIIETAEQYPELKQALLVHADLYIKGEIQ